MFLNLFLQVILYCSMTVLVLLPLNPALALQDCDQELEAFVSRESIGFLVLEEPQAFLESIEQFPLFSDARVERMLEILEDPNFKIVAPQNLDLLREQWADFKDIFASINEVALIVHPFENDRGQFLFDDFFQGPQGMPKFSVVINGTPESSKQLERFLRDARTLSLAALSQSQDVGQSDNPDDQLDTETPVESLWNAGANPSSFWPHGRGALPVAEMIEGLAVQRVDNFVIVSNDTVRSTELTNRLSSVEDKRFRSLSKNRSYQLVQKQLDAPGDSAVIRGFFTPKHFPELGTYLLTDALSFEAKSLPAAGVLLSTNPPQSQTSTPEGEFWPMLQWRFVMTFSQPPTEYAKVIQSFRPVKTIPDLGNRVMEYKAFGFDAQERLDAFAETIAIHTSDVSKVERETDDDADVESDSDREEAPDLNEFNDFEIYGIVGEPRTFDPMSIAGFTNANIEMWYGDSNQPRLGGWVKMHPVNDARKMELFFKQWIDAENSFQEEPDQYVEVENNYGRLFVRASAQNGGALGPSASDRTHGNSAFSQDGADLSPEEALQYETELFLNDQWLIATDHVTMQRLLNSLYDAPQQTNTFDQIFAAAREHNDDRPPVKINYSVAGPLRDKNRTMQYYHIEGQYHRQHRQGELKALLAQGTDEFGLYPFESKEDAIVACWQLLSDALSDTLGTSIQLLSVEKKHVRIFSETYGKVQLEIRKTK